VVESVYSAVRTDSLYKADCDSSLKGSISENMIGKGLESTLAPYLSRTHTRTRTRIIMILVMAVSFARRHDIWSWHCTSHITAMYLIVNNKLEAGLTGHCRAWLMVMLLVTHYVSHRMSPSIQDSSCIL